MYPINCYFIGRMYNKKFLHFFSSISFIVIFALLFTQLSCQNPTESQNNDKFGILNESDYIISVTTVGDNGEVTFNLSPGQKRIFNTPINQNYVFVELPDGKSWSGFVPSGHAAVVSNSGVSMRKL